MTPTEAAALLDQGRCPPGYTTDDLLLIERGYPPVAEQEAISSKIIAAERRRLAVYSNGPIGRRLGPDGRPFVRGRDRRRAARLDAPPPVPARKCEQCSEVFIPVRIDQRYCSGKCRQQAYRNRRVTDRLAPRTWDTDPDI